MRLAIAVTRIAGRRSPPAQMCFLLDLHERFSLVNPFWKWPTLSRKGVSAQVSNDAKSNEITAVPELLRMLAPRGAIVTADALKDQCAIVGQSVDQGGDYALALKGNP